MMVVLHLLVKYGLVTHIALGTQQHHFLLLPCPRHPTCPDHAAVAAVVLVVMLSSGARVASEST